MDKQKLEQMALLHQRYYDFLMKTDINDYRSCYCDFTNNRLTINPLTDVATKRSSSTIIDNYLVKYFDHIKSIEITANNDIILYVDRIDAITMKNKQVSIIQTDATNNVIDPHHLLRYLKIRYMFFADEQFIGCGLAAANNKIEFMIKGDVDAFRKKYQLDQRDDIIYNTNVSKIILRD